LLRNDPTSKSKVQNFAGAALLLISACAVSSSAQAFTCDDVRHLSAAEQDFWAKQLHITATERHRLWVACYRDYRPGLQAELTRR
jgi:hypothetical protein